MAPAALGLDTLNGSGGGPGTIEDASTYAVFTSTNSARPGENIVLWGSGLGADTADSDTTYTATPHSVNTPLEIYIGGVQANILYHGASGYPGLTQIVWWLDHHQRRRNPGAGQWCHRWLDRHQRRHLHRLACHCQPDPGVDAVGQDHGQVRRSRGRSNDHALRDFGRSHSDG